MCVGGGQAFNLRVILVGLSVPIIIILINIALMKFPKIKKYKWWLIPPSIIVGVLWVSAVLMVAFTTLKCVN